MISQQISWLEDGILSAEPKSKGKRRRCSITAEDAPRTPLQWDVLRTSKCGLGLCTSDGQPTCRSVFYASQLNLIPVHLPWGLQDLIGPWGT